MSGVKYEWGIDMKVGDLVVSKIPRQLWKNGGVVHEAGQSDVCGIIVRIAWGGCAWVLWYDGEQGWGGNDENLEVL